MTNCTKYKYISFEKGILDDIIDAVYVITLENDKNYNDIMHQINKFKLSKNNYIQINKRYEDCKQDLCEQKSYYHLFHNNIKIFKHSNDKNYNNILVLESDFIFDEKIRDGNVILDLKNFINNQYFNIYYLGVIPINFEYYSSRHLELIYCSVAHCSIISRNGRRTIINKYMMDKCLTNCSLINKHKCHKHDIWLNYNINNVFCYYIPLCYQTFRNSINTPGCSILHKNILMDFTNKDDIDKAWSTLYKILKVFHYLKKIFIIFIVSIVAYLIYRCYKKGHKYYH